MPRFYQRQAASLGTQDFRSGGWLNWAEIEDWIFLDVHLFCPYNSSEMNRDLRVYAKQTSFRLVVGFFVLLGLVGIGLIYAFYGREAALMGMICIGAALTPAILVWLLLWAIGWVVKKANE